MIDQDRNEDFSKDPNRTGGIHGSAASKQEGPVAGGADNTRGENKPSREGNSGGAKKGKQNPEQDSPQGSHAYKGTTRGADSSDKEFRNNQPNASTSDGYVDSQDAPREDR